MKKISCLIYALALILIGTNANSQKNDKNFDELKKEMRELIEKTMKSSKVVGLSFALVDNQEVVWSEGFGYSDKANKIKATPQTIYRVGSISKLFTATSVMQLAERGKINIDNPMQTYIPEFGIKSRFTNQGSITPRNIMTHHSGLPSDILYQFFCEKPDPFTSVVDLLNKEYTCTQPNTIFSYSNVGYSLLGVLVERASGEDFYEYTQKHLFQPMGMNSSAFRLSEEMKPLYSKGYVNGKATDESLIRDVPAGMLHSSVLDMANFIKMTFNNGSINGNQIIEAKTLNEMQTKQNVNCKLDLNFSIGLCWWLTPSSWKYAGKYAEHGGDTFAYHGDLATLTDHKIGVIVLDNTDKGGGTTRKVAKELLKKYLEFKTGIKPPKDTTMNMKAEKLSDKQLAATAGDYVLGPELIQLKSKNGSLEAKQSIATLVLAPNSFGAFSVKAKLLGLFSQDVKNQYFIFKNIDGVDYILFTKDFKDTLTLGTRVTKPNISEAWKARMGKYLLVNCNDKIKLFSDLAVKEKDGFICVETKMMNDEKQSFLIRPVSESEAIVEGIGRNTGCTLFFNGDEIYFAGLKFKKKS
jgi:Beta-lactamase class C and other penicillin binding proteins